MSLPVIPVDAVPVHQATIVWPRNPFHPADKDLYPVQTGSTVADWMRSQSIAEFPLPTVCLVNGQKAFSTVGMAMMSSMGGASGAIFGTFFRNGGKALAGKDALDAAGLAAFFQAGVDGVKQRGGAAVGDKTCVDAMEPAAQKAAEVASTSLADAITAIAAATEAGKEASKAMVAKFGRAKTLGEACIGFPVAGAFSVVVIVNAMRDYILA